MYTPQVLTTGIPMNKMSKCSCHTLVMIFFPIFSCYRSEMLKMTWWVVLSFMMAWFHSVYGERCMVTWIFLRCSQHISVSPVWANVFLSVCDMGRSPELLVLGSRTNEAVLFQALMETPVDGKRIIKFFVTSCYILIDSKVAWSHLCVSNKHFGFMLLFVRRTRDQISEADSTCHLNATSAVLNALILGRPFNQLARDQA